MTCNTRSLRRVAVNLDRKGKTVSAKLVAEAAQELDELRAEVARLRPREGGSVADRIMDALRGKS